MSGEQTTSNDNTRRNICEIVYNLEMIYAKLLCKKQYKRDILREEVEMEQDKELVEEILKLIREYRAIEKKKEMIYSENTLRDMERQVKIIRQVITGGI